jgi:hypothetical protein
VHRALRTLEHEGWRIRRSLPWRGHGDVDHVAIAPTGIAFAIETKTSRYQERHLDLVRDQAAWLRQRRRRWCPRAAFPVLCLVHGPAVDTVEDDVLIVSVDRLIAALRRAATTTRPSGSSGADLHAKR